MEVTDHTADAPELHVKDVARMLGCSPTFVYKLIRERKITVAQRGRCYRFRRAWVEEYQARTTRATAEE